MPARVTSYQVGWDLAAHAGIVRLQLAGFSEVVPIANLAASDFVAIVAILKEAQVFLSGTPQAPQLYSLPLGATPATVLTEGTNEIRLGPFAEPLIDWDKALATANPAAQHIIDLCEQDWPADKSDCGGFVRDVAKELNVILTGSANAIVDQILGPAWGQLADGVAAKEAADRGQLVIGGLRGGEQSEPSDHGHVVVVVSGPLEREKYPTAYWGRLNGVGERYKTTNWAWNADDRNNVHYAAYTV